MSGFIQSRFQELSIEECANTITHGLGLFLSVIAFFVILVLASLRGGKLLIASCAVYGVSLIILYAASTIYHGTVSPERKRQLQVLDHCCIYLLIAGSYTPFGLVILDQELGKTMLLLVWLMAILGMLVKLVIRNRFPIISVTSYLLIGWIGAFALPMLLSVLGFAAIALAVAGGIAYSLGVIFFAWRQFPHNHAIFHVFVLAGSILHFLAVAFYVIPIV